MRKIVVFMLLICISIMLLTGCNSAEAEGAGTESVSVETNDNSAESDTNAEGNSLEAAITEGDSVQTEENIEEILADMTVEEKIAYMMPAKFELGEDEVYTPEPVTAEMIMEKMEEIKVTEGEYMDVYNTANLAGLLVLNASCMDPVNLVN